MGDRNMIQRIFQEIRGNIIKNKSFYFAGDQVVFKDFNPNQKINTEENLLCEIRSDSNYYPQHALSYMKEKLLRGEVAYFVTPINRGYLLFWTSEEGRLCSRHFDVILNNTTIQNERGPLYKNWKIFKAVSFKNSYDYVL